MVAFGSHCFSCTQLSISTKFSPCPHGFFFFKPARWTWIISVVTAWLKLHITFFGYLSLSSTCSVMKLQVPRTIYYCTLFQVLVFSLRIKYFDLVSLKNILYNSLPLQTGTWLSHVLFCKHCSILRPWMAKPALHRYQTFLPTEKSSPILSPCSGLLGVLQSFDSNAESEKKLSKQGLLLQNWLHD